MAITTRLLTSAVTRTRVAGEKQLLASTSLHVLSPRRTTTAASPNRSRLGHRFVNTPIVTIGLALGILLAVATTAATMTVAMTDVIVLLVMNAVATAGVSTFRRNRISRFDV